VQNTADAARKTSTQQRNNTTTRQHDNTTTQQHNANNANNTYDATRCCGLWCVVALSVVSDERTNERTNARTTNNAEFGEL